MPIALTNPLAITVLSAVISLAPGSVAANLSGDRKTLLVHLLHTDDADASARLLYARPRPDEGDNPGNWSLLVASTIFFTIHRGAPAVHEILIVLFLFMTAPVSAHMMMKSGLHMRLKDINGAVEEKLDS